MLQKFGCEVAAPPCCFCSVGGIAMARSGIGSVTLDTCWGKDTGVWGVPRLGMEGKGV